MKVVKAAHLTFAYGQGEHKHQVFDDISFEVTSKETVGIIGCNGVGKSTLLKLLVGIELSYGGSLSVCEMEMNRKTLKKIRSRAGYVFQDSDSQLFMNTVREDVGFAPLNYGMTAGQVREQTERALKKVHMEEMADRRIYQLSGGEKKLAAIATVLVMEPEVIIMDEPSLALDPANRQNLINVLNEMDTAKVIASHDLDFIYDTCRRTILLYHGGILADGLTEDILTDEALLKSGGLMLPLSFCKRQN